jgi:four helix bundle protein
MAQSIIQEKSFAFALETIRLYQRLQEKHEFVLSKQLLRSGTSIGANVEEAHAGQSRKDFLAKMSIASKEARETRYWLRLLQSSKLVGVDFSDSLNKVEELVRILTAIVKTTSERPDSSSSQNSKLKTQN